MFSDRQRAQSFGADAERYDRARPSYPPELIDDLMASRPGRVLDVGCGTGKAGRLFRDRGCDVLGLEPDERMAAVARSHGLDVEVTTLEAWLPPVAGFDLIVSGQAWHWVDPAIGLASAATALRPGGWLAAFWNGSRHEPATAEAFDRAYLRHAPELRVDSVVLGTMTRPMGKDVGPIDASGWFEPAETRMYRWEQRLTSDEWIDQLGTHSDHALLPADQLSALLDAIGAEIEGLGGSINVLYNTVLIRARRNQTIVAGSDLPQ